MSEFIVPVVKVKIEPHPNADLIEIAKVGDYCSIVKKGYVKTGELAVYIPEASLVPENILQEMGLWDNDKDKGMLAGSGGTRVKAIKLRGVLSQGLIYPLLIPAKEGDDMKDILGITKYEPPIPVHLQGEVCNVHGHTLKYDIENLKKYPYVIDDNEEVVFHEKIHGCADFNTMVETIEYGNMKIGEIVKGKLECFVKSFDIDTQEILYEKIEGWSEMPNDIQWFEIETENGNILRLTGNHLVWCENIKCYREVKDLDGSEILLFD